MTVDLVPEWKIGDLLLTSYPYGVDADSTVDIGEPEMVVESVQSMLANGDLERVVRYGNRTYVLGITVEGQSLGELAEAEATLRRELSRPGLLLTHDPGDGFAPTSSYEVQTAQLTPQRNDQHEAHLIRKFTLTFVCLPHALSADLVTVEAMDVPVAENLVTIDTCDSATGWSSTVNGASAPVLTDWEPGAVSTHEILAAGGQTLTLTRIGTVNFSSTRYLRAEIGYRADLGALPVTCKTNAGKTLKLVEQRMISPGRFIYTYDTAGVTVSSLTFTSVTKTDTADLKIYDLARTDTPPSITPRQTARIIETGGTERTPASIHVEATPSHGGLTIVHTSPEDGSGYSPPLRRWRTSASTGPETVDANTLSGKREPIAFEAGGFYAEVPTAALPEGGYVLMARLRSVTSAANSITAYWSTSTIFPDTTTQQGYTNGFTKTTLPGTSWTLVPIAALSLPSVRTEAGKVQIVLQVITSSGPQVELDEAWLFRADEDCALTIVNHSRPHLWLDSPDVSSPVPRVWIGADDATRVHPGAGLVAQGNHVLHPDGTAIFTASMANNPATSASFNRRWSNYAAE